MKLLFLVFLLLPAWAHAVPAPVLPPDPALPSTPAAEPDRSPVFQGAAAVQEQLALARKYREQKDYRGASKLLLELIESSISDELKRGIFLELAAVSHDENQLARAQQIYGHYLKTYRNDPSVPDVLLRQGIIYRKMGVPTLAISKFYAVMSSSLNLKLEDAEYYQRLVLQAQSEIADTYYLQEHFEQSADFFNRLLQLESPKINREQVHYKLVRSLAYLTNAAETVRQSRDFLKRYPASPEVPEVRFSLANSLKTLGRNRESTQEVLLLLETQHVRGTSDPAIWLYWQRRAGNEIANQFYRDGDFPSALAIYLSLAEIDQNPAWQIPAWYQIALIHEQLRQPAKAMELYSRISKRQKEATGASPALLAVFEMARWRHDYVDWLEKNRHAAQNLREAVANNPVVIP